MTVAVLCSVSSPATTEAGQQPPTADTVTPETLKPIFDAAGGRDHLLTLFRMTEEFNFGETRTPKGTTRVSVVEPPASWWIGKSERKGEPAKFVVWAWTLGVLTDDKSRLSLIPDVVENEKPAYGIRVKESVTPEMDLYFDKADHRLVRVDWRGDIYRFSDWQQRPDFRFPAHCVIYKKATGKAWFFHQITDVERLTELPAGLSR